LVKSLEKLFRAIQRVMGVEEGIVGHAREAVFDFT
jgi:hypothetical protein